SDLISLGDKELFANWLILEFQYNEGLPELYQLPLAWIKTPDEESAKQIDGKAMIAKLTVGSEEGLLIDAIFDENFRNMLFRHLMKGQKIKNGADHLGFQTVSKSSLKGETEVQSKVLSAEQSNTSVIYNGKFFMKLYRKVDSTINPDLEITRFLTEKAQFANVPSFIGEISLYHKNQSRTVMAMMQEAVPNQGDAWEYTKDALQRYFERVLTLPKTEKKPDIEGRLTQALSYEDVPEDLQELFGGVFPERMYLLGKRTGEMHQALTSHPDDKDFEPEAFSLHYQRSLYSSLQSLTRASFQSLKQILKNLPDSAREEAGEILKCKDKVLTIFKRIFSHKIDTM